jgi:Domain of unknown function (DUF4251)
MKKILFCVAALILIMLNSELSCVGQTKEANGNLKGPTRKEKRAMVKKANQLVDSLYFVTAKRAIDQKKWSLEVKTLYDKNGSPVQNDDPRNSLSMRGETGHIRLSFKQEAKGIGSVSVSGRVSDYSENVDKKGVITIRYLVFNKGRNEEVFLTLLGNGNLANVEVESSSTGKRIRFIGNLVPLEKVKNAEKKLR